LFVLSVGKVFAEVNYVTPSTNELNKTKNWAFVEQISKGLGTTNLQFTSSRAFLSCFEYRTDGDTSQKISETNPNIGVLDGKYRFFCQINNTRTVTIPAEEYVEVRMVFGAERDERFDWTRFDVIPSISVPVVTGFLSPTNLKCGSISNIHSATVVWTESTGGIGGVVGYEYTIDYPLLTGGIGHWSTFRTSSSYTGTLNEGLHIVRVRARDTMGNVSGWSNSCSLTTDWTAPDVEITNPTGNEVSGVVDIRGSVIDSNPHHYWLAIYNSENKQVAGPGTVNRADSFTDELLMKWDTTKFPYGEYTIKLEARDAANNKDSGSIVWKTLTVDNDTDRDGVKDSKDLCNEGSLEDFPWESGKWGTNRWQVQNTESILGWYQNKPFKGLLTPTYTKKTMEYTCGCNGHQILERLSPFGNTMLGHWKFGLSSSLVEEFSSDCSDGTIDGMYLLDEVVVASNGTTVDSITTTEGVEYLLKASGTYTFALGWGQDLNGGNYGIADAKFNNRSASYNNGEAGWVNGAEWDDPYTNYLQVRTVTHGIDWIEDFNLDHIYGLLCRGW